MTRPKLKDADYHRLYHQAHRLACKAAEAIADNRTAADCGELIRFLNENRFSAQMVDELCSPDYHRRARGMMGDRDTEVQRLVKCIDEEKRKAVQRYKQNRRIRLAGAAAAAIIAGAILLHVADFRRAPEPPIPQASLTLSDGRTLALDRQVSETTIDDGSAVSISNAGGGLVVEQKSEQAVADPQPAYHTLNVSEGYQYDILLADKSRVWLNSGSSLRFPSAFGAGERRVYMEGEAYFEVSPDAERPFVVETEGQTLTVLGTSFNIYAYRNEPDIYTAVLTGRVSVRSGEQEITLSHDQACRLERESSEFSVRDVDAGAVAEWRNGVFVFDDNNLEQVAMKISRWYNVEIVYDHIKARSITYKGNLPRYESIGEMFESIEMTGPVKFVKQKDKYVMTM